MLDMRLSPEYTSDKTIAIGPMAIILQKVKSAISADFFHI